ncbi:MAG TPA: polyphosphate kinase 1 [Pyrinomonadaceae bacterium]|nr:polyphosphate kinase 1 [Pyrinomonadaceae bacterium]
MVARRETFEEPLKVCPATAAEFADEHSLLLNRELSLLEFHRRVLDEARDESNPLLERLKFLGIFASNIEEFFMVRVSALKEEIEEKVTELSPDGLTPEQQLARIRERLLPMLAAQSECLAEELLPQLKANGIEVATYESLPPLERHVLDGYFADKVFPVLTPLAVDPSHPFPYISPSSLNIGLMVATPKDPHRKHSQEETRFVRIKVPSAVPRLIPIGGAKTKFVFAEDLIKTHVHSLFPGATPGECHMFSVTRDADLDIREEEADDLLRAMQRELRQRRFGAPVRLEVSASMPSEMIEYLIESLNLSEEDVYRIEGPLMTQGLAALYEVERPDLKDAPFEPRTPEPLAKSDSIFDAILERDILLHHPFDSYSSVTDFVAASVKDPDVVAIKICLYRTGPDSPIPPALIEAAEKGKQVTALIELKARFDEAHNIEWARKLDRAGVHVVYGLIGLKTHGKLTLVVRREGDSLKRYVHIASGNYNPTTSCTYTDVGLLTANEAIGADASKFFNYLTGCSPETEYNKLLIAPVNMREKVMALIDREIEHQRAGRPARIIAKINRLADNEVIRKLYEASQAGLRIDLIVRGVCMLRPGVPGLSETITVRNIVGRFLEHSRIFYFANGGEEEVFLGSADWMHRNLSNRIEVLTPVEDAALASHLKEVVLSAYLRDNVKSRKLSPNGAYEPFEVKPGEERFDVQKYFLSTAGCQPAAG